ncbi:MAG: hypothetical protein Q8Q95_02785 [bacterium]|nr:hypothetical protein [bacterium]
MKLGFYSFDVAPGNNIAILAAEARRRGHEVVDPEKQKPVSDRAMVELMTCDMVVTGLSSFKTEMELDVARYLKNETKWVVLEDVPESCLRPKARDFANRADLLLMAPHTKPEDAARFGFRRNICLGPPPLWGKEYNELIAAKEANVRQNMEKVVMGGNPIQLQTSDVVVGLVGGKDSPINDLVLGMLIQALAGHHKAVVGFSQHPGEKATKPEDEERFTRAFQERAEMLSRIWHLSKNWKGVEVGAVADVMIYAGGTNASISGAYARIPGIYLDLPEVRARMVTQSGKETWFVAELGGALVVDNKEDLGPMIKTALSNEGRQYLLDMQEKNFPLPEDWHTEKKIIDYLECLV